MIRSRSKQDTGLVEYTIDVGMQHLGAMWLIYQLTKFLHTNKDEDRQEDATRAGRTGW